MQEAVTSAVAGRRRRAGGPNRGSGSRKRNRPVDLSQAVMHRRFSEEYARLEPGLGTSGWLCTCRSLTTAKPCVNQAHTRAPERPRYRWQATVRRLGMCAVEMATAIRKSGHRGPTAEVCQVNRLFACFVRSCRGIISSCRHHRWTTFSVLHACLLRCGAEVHFFGRMPRFSLS